MTRRHAIDWVLIVALTSVWAVLFARGVDNGLRTGFGQLTVSVSSAPRANAYPLVLSAGSWQELEPGDRLEAVEGEDLLGSSAIRFYDRTIRAARERGFASIRASRSGTPFETRLELTPVPGWWVELLGAALQFLVGLLLLVRAPHWHLARRNFLMLAGTAALNVTFDWKLTDIRGAWLEVTLGELVRICTAGLLIWNSQDFTRSARPVPRLHRALAVAALIAMAVTYLMRDYLPHTWAAQWISTVAGAPFRLSLSMLGLARAYLRSDRLERRQLRWVMLGFYVTFVGIDIAIVSGFTTARTFGRMVGMFCDLGIPVGILISVIGYRWLDVDRLISAATSYTILGLAVVGSTFAVLPGLSQAAAPVMGIGPATVQWLLTMALILAAIPAHSFLWPRIDRRMFAERNRRMLGFARLLDEIGSYASVQELLRLAGERLDALLEPDSITLYARTDGYFTPVLARSRAKSDSSFETSSPLVRTLEQRGRPLWANASELDAFDRAALETLDVELIVPIRGHDGVAAFVCLGHKRSGDIYTPQEVAHLGAVANRCSEVLLRLTEPPRPAMGELPAQVFRRDGEFWTIASAGKEIRLRDMRGLYYLATLLREPGREFPATDLVKAANGMPLTRSAEDPALSVVSGLGDAGECLDARARAAYRDRLREIETERAEAERNRDLGRLTRASEEREALLAELLAAARGRRSASHAERARVAVTKAIRTALEKIAERHPELGTHLSATIRRGYLCTYIPDPRLPSDWET
jgi:hypothetical protein